MKFLLKLLKDWTDPNGKVWKTGTVIEIDNKQVAGDLVMDKTAEVVKAEDHVAVTDGGMTVKAIEDAVGKAVEAKLKDLPANTAKEIHSIETKDLSDEDPSHGFLPAHQGREHTKEEKTYGLGVFAAEVYAAGPDMVRPSPRLQKSIERSRERVKKAQDAGLVEKTAGTGLQVGSETDIGAVIPPELNTMLLQQAAISATIRPLCSSISLISNTVDLAQVKDYDRSASLVCGGLLGYWKAEDAQLSESKPKMENIELKLNALTILAYASHQTMRFSPISIGSYLLPKMGDAITFKEEDAFINGGGAGMPQGILKANATVSIAIESGQAIATKCIVTENIDKMEARLKVQRAGAVRWMYSRPDLHVWLRSLVRAVGIGGVPAALYDWKGIAGGGVLDGIPLLDCEHMPAAGAVGDLSLVDWSYYLIADERSGVEVAESMHLKFDYGQTCFRMIRYMDGQMTQSTYTTRHKTTATVAPIVTIAVRS